MLHDIDYGKTEGTPEKHAILAEEILKELALLPKELIRAIKATTFSTPILSQKLGWKRL